MCYNILIKSRPLAYCNEKRSKESKKESFFMKAVISVTGKDSVGIIHKVSEICAKHGVNIAEISQSVLQAFFAMIMVVDIDGLNVPFGTFVDEMTALGKANSLEIHTMHEDIFNAMHRI